MHVVIEIPNKEIPMRQEVIDIHLHFIGGHVVDVGGHGFTELPKGHKRLIEDNFEVGPVFDEEGNRVGYKYVTQEDLNNASTIIEADM